MINIPKISYEPEADVLRFEVSNQPIDYAKEIGNFVIHFSKDNLPVYIEILEAKNFQKITQKAFKQPHIVTAFK